MSETLYSNPSRGNKRISEAALVDFSNDFFNGRPDNRFTNKYRGLRFGQAFIVHVLGNQVTDPELFYMTDVKRAQEYIRKHYVT